MSAAPTMLESLPLLTDVVHWASPVAPDPVVAPVWGPAEESLLAERVLALLQVQIGPALDARLHAAIAPVLARAAERVVHEARLALSRTLRDLVADAVAQALARPAPNGVGPVDAASQDQRLA